MVEGACPILKASSVERQITATGPPPKSKIGSVGWQRPHSQRGLKNRK